ncbi:MAG: VOC family protein [Spirochaetes bacterium]|nr:VOC family protein [Spirochaetota bacterium]
MHNIDSYYTQPNIRLPAINQLGIVVQDITQAVKNYTNILGIGPWFRSKTVSHQAIFRGKPITIDVDIVLAFHKGIEVELIQLKGGDECIYSQLIAQSGDGIHHVGSLVLSYNQGMKRVKDAGIEVIQSGVIITQGGAVTRYAYLDTVKQCGIITELIETRLYGLPVPQNKFFMEIGCCTGDVEKVQ